MPNVNYRVQWCEKAIANVCAPFFNCFIIEIDEYYVHKGEHELLVLCSRNNMTVMFNCPDNEVLGSSRADAPHSLNIVVLTLTKSIFA